MVTKIVEGTERVIEGGRHEDCLEGGIKGNGGARNKETSRTEFGQQMRSRELPAYFSLNRIFNGLLSYS